MTSQDEIANLMARYAEALDGARFDELGALFRRGEVSIEGGPHSGRSAAGAEAVASLYRDIVVVDEATGRTGTRHFISNFLIESDELQSASARSYFAVTQQTVTLPLQIVACGAYQDTFARHEDAWIFRSRRIICDQAGELGEHMR
jgi:3-phenylpropionate/cinnamic acid dioxygenase small subunit